MKVRFLDFGMVSALRSQSIYHGIAKALKEGTPNTITLMRPSEPYVCIGYHQELKKEVDLEYCKKHGIPIFRREIGGGAVYLDSGQLFYHTIFQQRHVPRDIQEAYKLFLQAPIETYRELGIPAEYRPINDLQVGGKKIGGTGAAKIGNAFVIAGSLLLDFNYEMMSRVLKVPDEKFRDKIYKGLTQYLTTIKKELGEVPPIDDLKRLLIEKFDETLGVTIVKGEPTKEEWRAVEKMDEKMLSRGWLHMMEDPYERVRKVKIAEGVHVVESAYKSPGGLIRTTLRTRDDVIEDILISGDFFIYPPEALEKLSEALKGGKLEEKDILARLDKFFSTNDVQTPGVGHEDILNAIFLDR
ncbi:MAG: lipoate--protein ligase [Candidatus Hydrothermarchaeales archaeon]